MANDRLILRCSFCGAEQTLAKYYPTWFTGDSAEGSLEMTKQHLDLVPAFISQHSTHHPRCGKVDLNGEPGFEIRMESNARTDPVS